MSIAEITVPESLADVLARLGDIPSSRVRWRPYPGTATVQDVVNIRNREKRLFELVEGVLVEKTMGWRESLVAMEIVKLLAVFVDAHDLGAVTGPDGMMQIFPKQIRISDATFISWQRVKGSGYPDEAAPHLAPDLAVEVISRGNTTEEMQRKLHDYFEAGVRLVWYLDPRDRSALVYTSPAECNKLTAPAKLDGGEVLPGFVLDLDEFFRQSQPDELST